MNSTKSSGKQGIPKMHWLVVGWVSISGYFAVAFPVAMWRVSQNPKFIGQAFKSQDCDTRELTKRVVVTSEMCAAIAAPPLPVKNNLLK